MLSLRGRRPVRRVYQSCAEGQCIPYPHPHYSACGPMPQGLAELERLALYFNLIFSATKLWID